VQRDLQTTFECPFHICFVGLFTQRYCVKRPTKLRSALLCKETYKTTFECPFHICFVGLFTQRYCVKRPTKLRSALLCKEPTKLHLDVLFTIVGLYHMCTHIYARLCFTRVGLFHICRSLFIQEKSARVVYSTFNSEQILSSMKRDLQM